MDQWELAEHEANLVRIFSANCLRHGFLATTDGALEIAKLDNSYTGVEISSSVTIGPHQSRLCRLSRSRRRWWSDFPMRGKLVESGDSNHKRGHENDKMSAYLGKLGGGVSIQLRMSDVINGQREERRHHHP